ncbi:dsDNA nuclease domain-containing protein [Fictibacillus fluitans]|uniref:DsDNA nuclease domain-containing protein n=1 Tax=Fictibacillus fluitans TaxID=3058422 RepID=A0ABT8I125_9BACL|nr:dsDNA nuclease domain-containing protein [Fictibacillus sp. NE201]MDN4526400.1 dsDNA nuclease domain-containing protein [Fictibacillus sp. NE201]
MSEGTEAEFDNGGAEAIKGFNFQKANVILLAINNYKKKNFKIYVEAEDDIVVSYEGYNAYIQVKKQKHTFKSITKKDKKVKKGSDGKSVVIYSSSILEKNLNSGTEKDRFKLIVKDFGATDKKQLKIKKPGSLCSELFELSKEAKALIIKALPADLVNKVENFYFYISPIHEDLNEAERYLIGCLNKINIAVDNSRGRSIIAELSLTIDQKAQEIIHEESHKESKFMDTKYFSEVLITCKAMNRFDEVLDSLGYNLLLKSVIKKERLKIQLNQSSLKEEMKELLEQFIEECEDLEGLSNKNVIDHMVKSFTFTEVNKNLLIAIAIESLCELGDENYDY